MYSTHSDILNYEAKINVKVKPLSGLTFYLRTIRCRRTFSPISYEVNEYRQVVQINRITFVKDLLRHVVLNPCIAGTFDAFF